MMNIIKRDLGETETFMILWHMNGSDPRAKSRTRCLSFSLYIFLHFFSLLHTTKDWTGPEHSLSFSFTQAALSHLPLPVLTVSGPKSSQSTARRVRPMNTSDTWRTFNSQTQAKSLSLPPQPQVEPFRWSGTEPLVLAPRVPLCPYIFFLPAEYTFDGSPQRPTLGVSGVVMGRDTIHEQTCVVCKSTLK